MRIHHTGRQGEAFAIDFFSAMGYTILAKNYRVRGGEIDLIVRDADTLAFVEVKTRSSARFSEAREAVNQKKQGRIVLAAQRYLQSVAWDGPCRFDVLEVYISGGEAPRFFHLPDAFGV